MHKYRITLLGCILTILVLLAPSGAVASTYTSYSGWLSFNYKDGWELKKTDQTQTRYVENVMLQPQGQDFSGRPGELILRVFDPFYVMEEAKTYDYKQTSEMFRSFVSGLPGEEGAQFSQQAYGNETLYVARSKSSGMYSSYIGRVDVNGYLLVVGAVGLTSDNKYPDQSIMSVLLSERFGGDAAVDAAPARAVASWYKALGRGDRIKMDSLSCANARMLSALVGAATNADGTIDIAGAMVQAARAFDFSDLRFITVQANSQHAVVRIAGLERTPGGRIVSFPNAAKAFGSNMVGVDLEGGSWRMCEPIRAR